MPNQNQFFQLLPFQNSENPVSIEQELRNIFFILGILILINKLQTRNSHSAGQLNELTTAGIFLVFGTIMHGCSTMPDEANTAFLHSQ